MISSCRTILAAFLCFSCVFQSALSEQTDDGSEGVASDHGFKDFRMIDEIILELEKTYPSNSFENIIADQNNKFIPVVGSFGPQSNFSLAGSNVPKESVIQIVGSSQVDDPRGSTSVPISGSQQFESQRGSQIPIIASQGSQSILPQSVDSNRYSNPDGLLDGIVDQKHPVFRNGSALQFLSNEEAEEFERGKRGALDLAQIIKCATGCDPLLFQGYGCFCGYLGSGEPVDGIDTCCKMHDWCYTTSTCMGLDYDLPYFVPFKWKCNGGAPYCIPGKSAKSGRNSCSHQLCECDREFSMCLKRYLPCPTSKAVCKKSPQRMIQNVVMGMASGHGHHVPKKPTYHAVPRQDYQRQPSFPHINFG